MKIFDCVQTFFGADKKEADKTAEKPVSTHKTNTEGDDTSYVSKKAAEAVKARAGAEIKKDSPRLHNVNTSKITGNFFPDFDEEDLTKEYLEFRKKARDCALETTRHLYRTFTTGDMKDLKDKNGNVIASFEFPDNEGCVGADYDSSSYKMIEWEKGTNKPKAITRVYNHVGFGKTWPKRCNPYMERIEFGKTPDEDTILRVTFDGEERADGRYILTPRVQLYAEGYKTEGEGQATVSSAKKYMSSLLHENYESYRTNYSAPTRIFQGSFGGYIPASVTEGGGIDGESFDSAVEYPQKQMKMGDTYLVINLPYMNKEGNKN